MNHELHISARGDREIVIVRGFNAPRRLVYAAHTQPELLQRWLGVRAGWILAVCEIDLRVGGFYRYVWRKESKGIDMGAGGVYRDILAPERLVCTERFDMAWYPGEALITTVFTEADGQTTLTMTILYESTEARQTVMISPMERGLAESYNQLATVLADHE